MSKSSEKTNKEMRKKQYSSPKLHDYDKFTKTIATSGLPGGDAFGASSGV